MTVYDLSKTFMLYFLKILLTKSMKAYLLIYYFHLN